jgi:hypothetical protein
MKTTNPPTRNSISRSPLRLAFLVTLGCICFALSPAARAVTPAPDGGYPNGNTAEGTNALFRLTNGINNTAVGFDALFDNTTGSLNIANGYQALYSNTTGSDNTANGFQALYSNTTGRDNTANGFEALAFNTTGQDNTANGFQALESNTTGSDNTANGFRALSNAITGSRNTGSQNTADGAYTLVFNTTGYQNTAAGYGALFFNTTGYANTVNGFGALSGNTTGNNNIALGSGAGENLTTGDNNIDIGNEGWAGDANTIRIGQANPYLPTRAFIAGIRGVTTGNANAVPVMIDSEGQLGTMSSSQRFKKEIKPMDNASETILALRPVTFEYKSDTKGTPQFGLIAEEVAEVDPDLVVRDAQGEIYSVRYEAVNAMLLNEFLKEHRTVQELKSAVVKQEATIAQQQGEIKALALLKSTVAKQETAIAALTASLKAQASQIQNVSALLEMSKPAPQLAGND